MPDRDRTRMLRLGELAPDGALTAAQRAELEQYVRVGHILALMQSQARQAVGRRQPAGPATAARVAPAPLKRRRRAS